MYFSKFQNRIETHFISWTSNKRTPFNYLNLDLELKLLSGFLGN